jgi:hypothetical protein
MKHLCGILLSIPGLIGLNAQEGIKVNLYKTTDDYQARTYTDTNVVLQVREISKHHIWFYKFVEGKSGKKLAKAHTSWAIEYNGNNYFNLGYSSDLNNWKVFLRFDVERKNFCASFITSESPRVVKNSGPNYGFGLQGVLMKDSDKWGKNWVDENGEKVKILFIDLNTQYEPMLSRNKGSMGNLLTTAEVKTIFGLELSKAEINQMSFEEIVELIKGPA